MIEVSRNRFRFCIFNVPTNAFMWLEDYLVYSLMSDSSLLKTLKTVYQEHAFLAANYWKSIRITFNSPNFTLIPEEFYLVEEASKYLQLAAGRVLTDKEQIFDYHHARFGAVGVFGVEKELMNWFKGMYPAKKISPVHLLDTLIEGIIQEENPNGLHLYFEEGFVSIIYFKENRLNFCNKFAYKTSPDLVYHVLFVMNELGLSPEETHVVFYGEITMFSEGYSLLSQQLKNINFAHTPKRLKFSQNFDELPEHRYFSLFSSYLLY